MGISPTLPSSSQLQPADFFPPPLATSQLFVLPPTPSKVATLADGKCFTNGCNSTRIQKECTHQRYKHHDKEQGGCLSHGNMPEPNFPTPHSLPISSTSPHIFANTSSPPFSSVIDLSPHSRTLTHILLVATQPPATPISTQALHCTEPTHASHILPIFTERLLGDAPRRLMSPPIFLRHLCIFLLIVASPRRSALAAPIPESDDHVT